MNLILQQQLESRRMDYRTAQLIQMAYQLGVSNGRAAERIARSGRALTPAEARMLDALGLP